MADFFPFIHEPKQKEQEPLPLYIELTIPSEYKQPASEETEESYIIIIQL